MKLTEKEQAYIDLYKGWNTEEAYTKLHPDIDETMAWFQSINLSNSSINNFITFITRKDLGLLNEINILNLDETIDMIISLTDVACRYALEKPLAYDGLLRYEHQNNQVDYTEGCLCSFKSTSKSVGEVQAFNYPENIPLSFSTEGYCPYLDIDELATASVFSDEREILFPPFLEGYATGEKRYEFRSNKEYDCVLIKDSFLPVSESTVEDFKQYYEMIKPDFVKELLRCQKQHEISPELNTYCSVIYGYLSSIIRKKYFDYFQIYNLQHGYQK